MYGTDHAVPSPRLADLVDAVNAARRRSRSGSRRSPTTPPGPRPTTAAPALDRRAAFRCAGEHADGRHLGADRPARPPPARAERVLERYAEPLAALHGGVWPERLLELAWRRVVDNSAHDSICGCSHDAVVAQVLTRFAEAEQIGRGIRRRHVAGASRPGCRARRLGRRQSVAGRPDRPGRRSTSPCGRRATARSRRRRTAAADPGDRSRRDPVIARIRLRGDEFAELIRRRRHGRELFGRQLNGPRSTADADARRSPSSSTMSASRRSSTSTSSSRRSARPQRRARRRSGSCSSLRRTGAEILVRVAVPRPGLGAVETERRSGAGRGRRPSRSS